MTGAGTDLKVAIGFFTLLTTFLIIPSLLGIKIL
jgi:hypothetical protein